MREYDFDKTINRKGTCSVKHDGLKRFFDKDSLTPLWVADMDFETPSFIIDAIRKRLEHPVLGYTMQPDNYWDTIAQWIKNHHGWEVKTEWMTYIPGVVKGIGMVINALVKEDEKVIIQPPVYHPFRLTPENNGRAIVCNPLRRLKPQTDSKHISAGELYEMDFEHLQQIADSKCKLLILSNPHNPAGIVWKEDTLRKLAHFCYTRDIIVISDEIHCDMAMYGNKHVPFASVSEEAAACSITFGAPTKTFNMAGVVSSYAIAPNDTLREKFFSWLEANEFCEPNMFAPIATIAAYQHGEKWRQEMLSYIENNINFIIGFCEKHIPQIKPIRPEASYLLWLDCRNLQIPHKELVSLFTDKAKLALNDGAMFGTEGEGFMRLNTGSPLTVIKEAMQNLHEAIKTLS
jgi:cystathionine beta-lyase